MPRKYARRSKRPTGGRRRRSHRKPMRRMRKTIAPMETACIKETLTLGPLDPNTPYEPQITLSSFVRSLDVADNYQQYRISRVEYKYTPLYDTFGALYSPSTSNVQVSLPYLYTKQQTVATPTAYSLNFLVAQGAKPIRLDDKTITHRYKPIVHMTASGSGIKPVRSPWLSTHIDGTTTMDATPHYTHNFWIAQSVTNPASAQVCTLEATIYFEFRKPWDKATADTVPEDTPTKVNPFAR